MKHFLFIFAYFLFFSLIVINAQMPSDSCQITTSWANVSKGIGSNIYELGLFKPTTFEEVNLKTFKDFKTGMFVVAKIKYGDFSAVERGKPTYIELSMSISDKEQEAAKFSEGTSSQTIYGKRWGMLSVEKLTTIDNLVHKFKFSCNDGRKKWQRVIYSKPPSESVKMN